MPIIDKDISDKKEDYKNAKENPRTKINWLLKLIEEKNKKYI